MATQWHPERWANSLGVDSSLLLDLTQGRAGAPGGGRMGEGEKEKESKKRDTILETQPGAFGSPAARSGNFWHPRSS